VKDGIVIASRGYQKVKVACIKKFRDDCFGQYELYPLCDEHSKVKVVCIKKCRDDCFGQYVFEPPRVYLSDPHYDFDRDWIIWMKDEYGHWDYLWVRDEKYHQCFRKVPE